MVLVLWEMQSALSRIWTHVDVFIAYDGNYYNTGTNTGLSTSKNPKKN